MVNWQHQRVKSAVEVRGDFKTQTVFNMIMTTQLNTHLITKTGIYR